MLNFKKGLNLKIISVMLSALFIFTNTLYSCPVSNDHLRIPIDKDSYRRERQVLASNHVFGTVQHDPMRRWFVSAGLTAVIAPALETMATTLAVPRVISAKSNDKSIPLEDLLKGRYPPKILLLVLREVKMVFSEIDLMAQRQRYSIAFIDPDKPDSLVKLIQIIRDTGYTNVEQPKLLPKLMINGLIGGQDLFKILNESSLDIDTKRRLRRMAVACTFIGELVYLRLKTLNFDVRRIDASLHSFPAILKVEGKILYVIDAALNIIGEINLTDYYTKQGNQWILNQKHRVGLSEGFGAILNSPTRDTLRIEALTEQQRKELLSSTYSSLEVVDTGEAYSGFTSYMLLNIGYIFHKVGQPERAADIYEEVIRLTPNFSEAYNNLSSVLTILCRFDEAIGAAKNAIKLNPNFTEAYNNLGVALVKTGKPEQVEQAVVACREAIRLNPQYAQAYNNLGLAYFELYRLSGKPEYVEQAIVVYKKAIGINHNFAEIYFNLGNALNSLGKQEQFEQAAEAYKSAIGINSRFVAAHINLANALNNLGRFKEAINAAKTAINISSHPIAYMILGDAYYKLGQENDAITNWAEAIRLDETRGFNLGLRNRFNSLPLPPELKTKLRTVSGYSNTRSSI